MQHWEFRWRMLCAPAAACQAVGAMKMPIVGLQVTMLSGQWGIKCRQVSSLSELVLN
jgi:hypothetical protein